MFANILKSLFKKREETAAAARREEGGDVVKPFLEHLEDLRWTAVKMAMTLAIAMAAAFVWHKEIFHLLELPLARAGYDPRKVLFMGEFSGAFMVSITLSFYAGIVVSFPLLMYFLAEFVLPALTSREKRYALPAIAVGFALFLGGAAFCFHYITPMVSKFFVGFAGSIGIEEKVEARSYFKTVSMMSIAFGLLCQLPVVMITLNAIGIVTYKWIAGTRSYAVFGIFILCGVVSPSPDIASLFLFALPLIALYEACIWIIWFLDKRRAKKDAERERRMNMPYDDKHEPID